MGVGISVEDRQFQSGPKMGSRTKMTETACFDFRQDMGVDGRRHSDHSIIAARGGSYRGSGWQVGNGWQAAGCPTKTGLPDFRIGNCWKSSDSSSNVSRDTSRKPSNEFIEDQPTFSPSFGSSNRNSSSSSTSSSDNQCVSLMMVQGEDGYVDLTSGMQSWSRKKTEKRNSFNEKHGLWAGESSKIHKRTFFNS